MKQFFSIAKFTIKENIQNKVFVGFIFFGFLILIFTSFLKELSLYNEIRVIITTGIVLIEYFVLMISIYISASTIINDKERKSIYLILTKPVSRTTYILGRVAGIIATIATNIALMTIVLIFVIMWQKGSVDHIFYMSILFIMIKLSIIVIIGVFFSIVSDSIITANLFTFSIYIVSHGISEIKQIAEESGKIVIKLIFTFFYWILPNFRVLNYRDYLQPIEVDYSSIFIYSAGYVMILMGIIIFLFKRKKL